MPNPDLDAPFSGAHAARPLLISRSARLDGPGWLPVPWEVSWEALAAGLCSEPYRTDEKLSVPLWSAAEVDARGQPLRVHVAVFDLDTEAPDSPHAIRAEQVLACLERVRAAGLACVLHSTHSATEAGTGRTKARLVIPLARPVPASAWRATWSAIRDRYAPEADRSCKDPGRRYFAPSCPVAAPPEAVYAVTLPGVPLEPPDAPTGILEPPPADRAVTREELALLASAWRRKLNTARHGIALRSVLDGEPYAEPGNRDQATWSLAQALAGALPDVDPAAIAGHFAGSLSLMGDDAPTVQAVADKIRRARNHLAEIRKPTERAPVDARILVTPMGSLYFVKGSGWEGPFNGDAVDLAITRGLEGQPGIELLRPTPTGPQPKPRSTLLADYGERLLGYSLELGARDHAYDPETRTFTEAAARPRALAPLTPVDEEIARTFLDALAHGDAKIRQDLDTWLARLPYLDDTLAALVFIGPPGLGKGLFASACARLWTESGPTDADDAFGTWNDGILRCPLIFADEKLPENWRGKDLSAEIRKIIGSRTTPIRRRFTPQVNARGCVRMFMAANNDSILSFSGASTEDDIRAISERFYVVRLTGHEEQIRAFFARHPGAHDRLVRGDALARYALSLPQPAERMGRFWICGPVHDAEKIAIRAGNVFNLLSWVVAWLQRPENLTSAVHGALSTVTEDRQILVSLGEVSASWQRYFPGETPPERTRLAAGARAVATQQRNAKGRLWSISHAYVDAWIRDAGWTSPPVQELISARLAKPRSVLTVAG